ncbi:MAG TPA: hypothetical protein VNU93_02205, partial [Verrucomicrobiae bacterium]|nr:hypothetical protein [Verrucomicrobiae bacterium]
MTTDIPTYRKSTKPNLTTKNKNSKFRVVIRFLARIDLWANVIAAFLLARAVILGELLPFGIAFFAALVAQRPNLSWPVGIAVLAGTATVTTDARLLGVGLSLGMLGILLRALKRQDSWLVLPGVVFTGIAVVKAGVLTLGQPSAYAAAAATLECLLITVLTLVFVAFFKGFQRIRTLKDLSVEETLCLIVLATGLVNGMDGISLWQVSLGGVLCKIAILCAALLSGPGAGAAVGIFTGFIPSLAGGGISGFTGIMGIAGLVGGLFHSLGKPGVAAGFFLASFASSYYLSGGTEVVSALIETLTAILIFLILPVNILDGIRTGEGDTANSKNRIFDFAALRVQGLAEIFEEIAQSYQHAAALDNSLAKPDVPGLMNILADRVCANCPVVKVCWEKDFYKTYKNLLEIFTLIELKGNIQVSDLPPELRRQCGRIKEMVLAINFIFDNQRTSQSWAKKYVENKDIISSQLRGVSGMMSNLAEEISLRASGKKSASRAKSRRRRDFLDIGVATLPKTGNSVCGDGYASIAIGDDKHALILSDGMGVGEKAAKESSAALSLLEQLLRTGFDGESAIKTLNSILVL